MASSHEQTPTVARLQERIENAMARGENGPVLEDMLQRLCGLTLPGSELNVQAHRFLAETYLHSQPWKAALHLRACLKWQPDDDIALALTGLCHALLGNFKVAIRAYRRALSIAPGNPWYHHNLGHLLDVACHNPKAALTHLELAYAKEPDQDEVVASLARCLADLNRHAEAEVLATKAVRLAPGNLDHQMLLEWVEKQIQHSEKPRQSRTKSKRKVQSE